MVNWASLAAGLAGALSAAHTARQGRVAVLRNARRSMVSDLHFFDEVGVVGAELVPGIGRPGDVGWFALDIAQGLDALLGPFLFDDLPPGVIERHRVAGNDEAVEWPGPLRHIRRSAFILGRDGI